MLGLSSIFLFNFFYMYFATRPRPALTAVIQNIYKFTSLVTNPLPSLSIDLKRASIGVSFEKIICGRISINREAGVYEG